MKSTDSFLKNIFEKAVIRRKETLIASNEGYNDLLCDFFNSLHEDSIAETRLLYGVSIASRLGIKTMKKGRVSTPAALTALYILRRALFRRTAVGKTFLAAATAILAKPLLFTAFSAAISSFFMYFIKNKGFLSVFAREKRRVISSPFILLALGNILFLVA